MHREHLTAVRSAIAVTALGPGDSATLRLRVLDNGYFLNKDVRVPVNVVAMLRADSLQRSYRDTQNQVQTKVSLLSRVHYMCVEDLQLLRSVASSEMQNAVIAVVLEIISANARDCCACRLATCAAAVSNRRCSKWLSAQLLREELDEYFVNTLIPLMLS